MDKEKDEKESDAKAEGKSEDQLTEKEKAAFRKFLKDGSEFRGLEKTAIAVLQREKPNEMKLKKLAKQVSQIYRMSEDFDSDSDESEDKNAWLASKKQVKRRLKEC